MKEEKAAEVEVDNMYYNLIESNYGKSCNLKVRKMKFYFTVALILYKQ